MVSGAVRAALSLVQPASLLGQLACLPVHLPATIAKQFPCGMRTHNRRAPHLAIPQAHSSIFDKVDDAEKSRPQLRSEASMSAAAAATAAEQAMMTHDGEPPLKPSGASSAKAIALAAAQPPSGAHYHPHVEREGSRPASSGSAAHVEVHVVRPQPSLGRDPAHHHGLLDSLHRHSLTRVAPEPPPSGASAVPSAADVSG